MQAFNSNTKTRGSLGRTGQLASLLCEFQATERAYLRTTTKTSNSLQENQTRTWKAPGESTCGSFWLPHKPMHTCMSSSVTIYTKTYACTQDFQSLRDVSVMFPVLHCISRSMQIVLIHPESPIKRHRATMHSPEFLPLR